MFRGSLATVLLGLTLGLLQAEPGVADPLLNEAAVPPGLLRSVDFEVERERYVTLTEDVLGIADRAVLDVNLFDDVRVAATRVGQRRTFSEGVIWHGEVAGRANSLVLLSAQEDVVIANITLGPEEFYQIRYVGDGTHIVRQVEPGSFPPEALPDEVSYSIEELDAAAANPLSDDGSIIEVLVVYTQDARSAEGGTAAIEALIHLAMYETNLTYLNSDIDQRLNLVHLAEVTYTETGNITTDRNRLKNPSDGHMDNVHALRDLYCADVVSLLVDDGGAYCGIAYIMSTVSTAFESSAFCVVDTDCATGYYSYGHEFGHIMSARHDWWVDDTNNSPYTHNHAYVNVGDGWRTVMGYNNECNASSTYCTRLPYWSNPTVTYGGDPMGTVDGTSTSCTTGSAGTCNAENWKTLNNTAGTVANFRDSCVGTEDVWMKDTWTDTGAEPDPLTASQHMWKSPYIWVRHSSDSDPLHQHQHQNPEFGQNNYVYAELHNGGGSSISGTLRLYYAEASAGLAWPGDWTEFDAIAANIPGDGTEVLEGIWGNPPGTGHYCLLARWISAADPMTYTETSSVNTNTRNNNNIVWRNVNVLDDFADGGDRAEFWIRNVQEEFSEVALGIEIAEENGFLRYGELRMLLDEFLYERWLENGAQGFGIEPLGGGEIQVFDPNAMIRGIPMQPREQGVVKVEFLSAYQDSAGSGVFEADFVQYQREEVVGGVGYEIDVLDFRYQSINGGTFDHTGVNPIGGVDVFLYERVPGDLIFVASTQSGAQGGYGFPVPPGTYRVCFEHPDYFPECYSNADDVNQATNIMVTDSPVHQVDATLVSTISVDSGASPAQEIALRVLSPNPLTSALSYSLSLPSAENVRLSAFDVTGRQVATLLDTRVESGFHQYSWDLVAADGTALTSGVYYLQLRAGAFTEYRKLSVIR